MSSTDSQPYGERKDFSRLASYRPKFGLPFQDFGGIGKYDVSCKTIADGITVVIAIICHLPFHRRRIRAP